MGREEKISKLILFAPHTKSVFITPLSMKVIFLPSGVTIKLKTPYIKLYRH
jgi:hypothetical protein